MVLELLSTLRPGSAMPVGALIEAGALFGISDNNVRVTVARLLASGRIARDDRGRYRLGAKTEPIGRRVRSWRDLDGRTRPWDGTWVAVHAGPAARGALRGREHALRLFGFRRLRPGLWLRPDNLALAIGALRDELAALGLPPGDLVCILSALDRATDTRARRSWDAAALQRAYRTLDDELRASAARLDRLPAAAAMVESFRIGGRAMRQLVLDPLLPDEICSATERTALVARLVAYDRAGRLAWAELLKRYDVPYLRAPLDAGRGGDDLHEAV
jgi:phenylacetic acid degradation operon negative regulatory protein